MFLLHRKPKLDRTKPSTGPYAPQDPLVGLSWCMTKKLPNRIKFHAFDRCFCKVETRVKRYAVGLSV